MAAVTGSAVAVYSVAAYLLGEAPAVLQRLLGLGCAAMAAAVFFWCTRYTESPEEMMLRLRRGQHSDFGKRLRKQRTEDRKVRLPMAGEVRVRTLVGIGVFLVVFGWWLTPLAPMGIKVQVVEDLTAPLGDEILAAVLVVPDGRVAALQAPVVPPSARELAGEIGDEDAYKRGTKAIVESRFADARSLLETAAREKPVPLQDVFLARAQTEMYAGRFQEAAQLYAKALDGKPDDPKLLCQAAVAWMHLGQFAKAEPLVVRALEKCRRTGAAEDPTLAACLHVQAVLYAGLGKSFDEAASMSSRAYNIFTKALGREHQAVAATLNNQAILYMLQGNYHGASPLFEGACERWSRTLGAGHLHVATGLANRAMLQVGLGRFADADQLAKQVLAIHAETLPEDHPRLALGYCVSAVIDLAMGRYDAGQTSAENALRIAGETAGREHVFGVALHTTAANLYREKALYSRAESHYRIAEAAAKKVGGPEHPCVAGVLNELARLYLARYRAKDETARAKAEETAQQALRISKKAFGENHPEVAEALNSLGELEIVGRRPHQARSYLNDAMKIRESVFDEEHPLVAQTLGNLAALNDSPRTYGTGVNRYSRAIAMAKESLGQEHPELARLMYGLAVLHAGQRKPEKAEPLLNRALAIQEKTLVPYHPDLAATLEALAALAGDADPERAAAMLQRAESIRGEHAKMDRAE